MMSAQTIAVVKIAVDTCNNPELKKEILCLSDDMKEKDSPFDRKNQWNERIERKATPILKKLGFKEILMEKIIGIVQVAGMRMLTWAVYHERILDISREYSMNFLNISFFTPQGIIDNKKAAEELIKDKNLSNEQKYKVACLYCFTDHISALYKQLTKDEKVKLCRPQSSKQPGIVRFWTYYLMGEVDKIKDEKTLDQYRLEKAAESGSKAAVEYFLDRTQIKEAIVDVAVEAIRNWITMDDWVVFRDQWCDESEEPWVPSDYYVDIVSFLLLEMKLDQQTDFLKKDIEGVKYKKSPIGDHKRSRVLECFLSWPYQGNFMKTAELMWEFLPERDYAILLLRICDKIESKENNFKHGEEINYDYRRLLWEFWYQSPERYKRYVFSNREVAYKNNRIVRIKAGEGLLIELLALRNFTRQDQENFSQILASATDKEKENIISSKELNKAFIKLIRAEKWEMLDWFVLNCFTSNEQVDKFKRKLIFSKKAQFVCTDFVKNDKYNSAELFLKWSSLPEEEIKQLKKEVIYTKYGECIDEVLCREGVEVAKNVFNWCFSSEEQVRDFTKEFIFSDVRMERFADLVINDKIELVEEFIHWCLSTPEEIKEFKSSLTQRMGTFICELLISGCSEKYGHHVHYSNIAYTTKFKGAKWEEAEKFLTWCFSSEKEISDFKKNVLLKTSGEAIHFNLIRFNQWEEADTFFAWLSLSEEEIKKLKKDTLLYHTAATDMFSRLLYGGEGEKEFVQFGSKQDAIQLLLRWYLADKEAVLEFRDRFKFLQTSVSFLPIEYLFGDFDLMIEQRLTDLDEEQTESSVN